MDQQIDLQKENERLKAEIKHLERLMAKLVSTVKAMRIAQGDYYRYHGKTFLNKARVHERKVNELIREEEARISKSKTIPNEPKQLTIPVRNGDPL